jgi:hypothetical protein
MAKYHEFYVTIIVHHKYRLRKNDHLSNQGRVQGTLADKKVL